MDNKDKLIISEMFKKSKGLMMFEVTEPENSLKIDEQEFSDISDKIKEGIGLDNLNMINASIKKEGEVYYMETAFSVSNLFDDSNLVLNISLNTRDSYPILEVQGQILLNVNVISFINKVKGYFDIFKKDFSSYNIKVNYASN